MIDNIMKGNNFDMFLLTETNVNSNCVEYWDSCTAFFSTSIDPKVKEREEKKREDKIYRSSYPENEQRLPNYRLAADFENAGVGIVIKNTCITRSRAHKWPNHDGDFYSTRWRCKTCMRLRAPIVLIPQKTRNTFMIN